MKIFIILVLLFAGSNWVICQERVLEGFVYDAESEEPVIGALVFDITNKSGTYTNEYGHFSIDLNTAKHIQISFIGYQPIDTILKESLSPLTFKLQPIVLSEVVVNAQKSMRNNNPAKIILPIKTLNHMPTIGGEKDIFKSLSLLPGVSTGQEGSSNLFIRGGTPDQNLVLLDGIPVYNTTHLGGYLSVFNSDAINNVQLIKGGFPARYGGRLSSIIDIQMNNGNRSNFSGNVGLGLLNSSATCSTPLTKHKSSIMVAGRTAYLTLLKGFFDKENDYFYSMSDLNIKNHFQIGKGSIFFSFYKGSDKSNFARTIPNDTIITSQNIHWGNNTASIRYITPLSNRLFAKVLVGITTYSFKRKDKNINKETKDILYSYSNSSKIRDHLLKLDFNYTLNKNHELNFGAGGSLKQFAIKSFLKETLSKDYTTPEYYIYAEDNFRKGRFSSNIGIRWSHFYNAIHFSGIEPRILTTFKLTNFINIHGGASIMTQYISLLPNPNGFGLPNDIWVPITKETNAQTGLQASIGADITFSNWVLTIDAYKKKMTHQITFKKSLKNPFAQIGNWESLIEKDGKGDAYGADFFVKKQYRKFNFISGYTISRNYRQFNNINQGERYFFTYDKTHDFSINVTYAWKKKIMLTGNWVYSTGRAITLPVASTPLQQIYSKKNSFRLPSYHRLDLGIEYSRFTQEKNKWIWNFSIYNAYNRINPNLIRVTGNPIFKNGQYVYTERKLKITSLFPLIPGASIRYEFTSKRKNQ